MAAAAPRGDVSPAPFATGLGIGHLDRLVGFGLRRAQVKVFEDANRVLAPLGLRPALLGALIVIDANPGSSQAEVAAALGIQRPNYVAMMDELESRRLAQRQPSTIDRRSNTVFLTTEGKKLLRKAIKIVTAHEDRLLAPLDAAQRETLLDLLRQIGR